MEWGTGGGVMIRLLLAVAGSGGGHHLGAIHPTLLGSMANRHKI